MAEAEWWWSGDPRERFWVEATDRLDIGANLKAPLENVSGEDWRYGLFRDAAIGDLVFHYDSRAQAITSVSRISGPEAFRTILWAARGSYAKARGAEPEERLGYVRPLDEHRALREPLTLGQLRASDAELRRILGALEDRYRRALYFPFEVGNREVWPNQGYAFKLPADVVAHYPALAEAAGAALIPPAPKPPLLVPDGDAPLVRRAAEAIDAARWGYDVGPLQWLRKKLRNGKTRSGPTIFHPTTTFDRWAFHYGGRKELQFNIGLDQFPDGAEALRVGIGFSLEQSQALKDWRELLPRIRRFNDYLAANPDDFVHDWMWRFDPKDRRSPDHPPGPIADTILAKDVFIFLGQRFPVDAVDVHACLRIFDRLLPLYRYVQDDTEASGAAPVPSAQSTETPPASDLLRLEACVETRETGWRTRTIAARILDIPLRHNEIQNRLKAKLLADGLSLVGLEARLGQRAIDIVTQHDGQLWFWEVKTAGDVRQCLREAIGQLLEYALWDDIQRPDRLIVVGDAPMTPASRAYLERLNARFPIPLDYRQFELVDD